MTDISTISMLITAISAATVAYYGLYRRASLSVRGGWRLSCLLLAVLGLGCYTAYRFFGALSAWPAHAAMACFWVSMAASCYHNVRRAKKAGQGA